MKGVPKKRKSSCFYKGNQECYRKMRTFIREKEGTLEYWKKREVTKEMTSKKP